MALFKILKGSNKALFTTPTGQENNSDHPSKKTVQGYCYFTPDNGKFYIDVADSSEVTLGTNRICLNAEKADKLATARAIGNASFDGSKNITLNDIMFIKDGEGYPAIFTNSSDANAMWLRAPQTAKAAFSTNGGFLPIQKGALGNGNGNLGQ